MEIAWIVVNRVAPAGRDVIELRQIVIGRDEVVINCMSACRYTGCVLNQRREQLSDTGNVLGNVLGKEQSLCQSESRKD